MESREPLCDHLQWGFREMWSFLRHIGLTIRQQKFSSADVVITAQSTSTGAPCPACGRVSRRQHSSYTRLLMDLPADGRTVNIQLLVRRFRGANPACRHRLFAERFPQLIRPHARRTQRLEILLTRIDVLLGGEVGARLSQDLCVPVSPDTMLRLLYRMKVTPASNLRVVGIDDWAWRKGVLSSPGVKWLSRIFGAIRLRTGGIL